MSSFNAERPKDWNIYGSSSDPSPSQAENNSSSSQGPWKNFGTSMNAISFGFVATAILISMFLIMAIFEHLFKPSESFSTSDHGTTAGRSSESPQMQKRQDPQTALITSYSSDVSVVMPGQQYPTFIAQPAPLPCRREGVCWPPHEYT